MKGKHLSRGLVQVETTETRDGVQSRVRAKEDKIEVQGIVIETLPNATSLPRCSVFLSALSLSYASRSTLSRAGGNIGVSVGPDGILLVDDQFAPLAEKIRTTKMRQGTCI